MSKRRKVALLIESSREYGRGLLRGVAAYSRAHGPWAIYHQERRLDDPLPNWLTDWSGDGILARADSRQCAKQISQMQIPAVDLRGLYRLPRIPLLTTNDEAVAEAALNHLRQCGFTQFAYCGFPGVDYSDLRYEHFRESVEGAGQQLSAYDGDTPMRGASTREAEATGMFDELRIADWIRSLPKPIGLMACNDIRGQQVLSVCRDIDVAVPEEVAVIGVDNDRVLCELSDPPLSSVILDTERTGYEAAAMLDRMMSGAQTDSEVVLLDPIGVEARISTDVIATTDRDLARALTYIRAHACEGISVADVVKHVHMSRSSLERRFSKLLRRTPNAEINRIRIERVKYLLRETNYPLSVVASKSGFEHVEYMSVLFREKVGQTPGEFRKAAATIHTPGASLRSS